MTMATEASARAWRFPERTAVAVNLRQHRRRQLLRGNGREWFLNGSCCAETDVNGSCREAAGSVAERLVVELSCHGQTRLNELIYKIGVYSINVYWCLFYY